MRAVPGFGILGVLNYDVLAFLNGREFQTPMQVRRFVTSDNLRQLRFKAVFSLLTIYSWPLALSSWLLLALVACWLLLALGSWILDLGSSCCDVVVLWL